MKLKLSHEVQLALKSHHPVVALESTIISHGGIPYPQNLEVARTVESIVRSYGAIPATIAVLSGTPCVGVSEDELNTIAENRQNSVSKCSTRDLAYFCSRSLSAATTVASTMRLAHLAGIKVFATGGIGGVHRGVEESMDISADLQELSKIPVTVVCAGIKSILDIGKSLEALESLSVPVVGYKCEMFPAFYTNNSGFRSPLVCNSESDIAKMMVWNSKLNIHSGILVGVPNPLPVENVDKIEQAIQEAIEMSIRENIKGTNITPFLLMQVAKMTSGLSLESNVELIKHNAKIASLIAREYYSLTVNHSEVRNFHQMVKDPPSQNESHKLDPLKKNTGNIMVVGGSVMDIIGSIHQSSVLSNVPWGTSNPGKVVYSPGGVGRNIATALAQFSNDSVKKEKSTDDDMNRDYSIQLASVVTNDISGLQIMEQAKLAGIDTSLMKVLQDVHEVPSMAKSDHEGEIETSKDARTAIYNAIHDPQGELCVGVADMEIFQQLNPHFMKSLANSIESSHLVIVDGNISSDAFKTLTNICQHFHVSVFFEPTSVHKCLLPFQSNSISKVDMMKPNVAEVVEMAQYCLDNNLLLTNKALVRNTLHNLRHYRNSRQSSNEIKPETTTTQSTSIFSRYFKTSNPKPPAKISNVATSVSYNTIDEVDIRMLGSAVYLVMLAAVSQTESKSVKSKLIHGRHLIVSMGSRGIMWFGPSEILATCNRSYNVIYSDDGTWGSCTIPAITIEDKDKIAMHSTNGAGDAFCAGMINSMMKKYLGATNATLSKPNGVSSELRLPNSDCIMDGLKAAQRHILKNTN